MMVLFFMYCGFSWGLASVLNSFIFSKKPITRLSAFFVSFLFFVFSSMVWFSIKMQMYKAAGVNAAHDGFLLSSPLVFSFIFYSVLKKVQ